MEYERLTQPLDKREVDIGGKVFHRLTALYPTTSHYSKSRIWAFRCECGNVCFKDKHTVVRGHCKSCGCLGLETKLNNCGPNRTSCVEGTNLGNLINPVLKKNNRSGVNGVSVMKNRNHTRYRVQITFKRKNYYIGEFITLEEAAKARKIAEDLLFKPAILRNFESLSDHLKKDYFKQLIEAENNKEE